MIIRSSALVLTLLALPLAGCEDKKKSADTPGAVEVTPPAETGTPPGETSPPAQPTAADPAKVDEAANTALKIMAVVSSAVRGAKGDCARMKQNLNGVMTVAQKWRDQLAEQYKDPAVKQGVKAGLAAGKFPELKTNLDDTRSGAQACPDAAPDYDKVLTEIE